MRDYSIYQPGFSKMVAGWRLTLEKNGTITVECGMHRDVAKLLKRATSPRDDITVVYEKPERVPPAIRKQVKILFRLSLSRSLQCA